MNTDGKLLRAIAIAVFVALFASCAAYLIAQRHELGIEFIRRAG